MSGFATCAGFRAELLVEIARCGIGVELGDHVPFTEWFADGDRSWLAVVVAAALRRADAVPLAFDELFEAPCVAAGPLDVRPLSRAAVRAVAPIDDLALAGLWSEVWRTLGRDGSIPPELTQSIRGFVVHCRAAVANGWDVLVVEPAG